MQIYIDRTVYIQVCNLRVNFSWLKEILMGEKYKMRPLRISSGRTAMAILLAVIKLLKLCSRRFLLWFFVPLHPHYGYKLSHSSGSGKHLYPSQKTEWIKHEIIRPTGMTSASPDIEICHVCFPFLTGKTDANQEDACRAVGRLQQCNSASPTPTIAQARPRHVRRMNEQSK